MTIELKNFSIGLPKQIKYSDDKEMISGICKETVEEAFLSKEGFHGDGVADLRFHGGPDRAVCVFPYEHYTQWKEEFGEILPPSAFGENLTVSNMLEAEVYIGDIYRIGDAVIQVTQSRIPCSTITKRTNLPLLLKRMVETGYTGYLCRVLEEGIVKQDSEITLLERDTDQVSVLFSNQIYFHHSKDLEAVKQIVEVPALASEWKKSLIKKSNKYGK